MNSNNNNRGSNNNNNRRRGRSNRPGGHTGGSGGGSGGGGGGQQLNRVDSRARGNAPQLLEKYRKLAQDAHQNGDRVQAEYYLQFADHYFRVGADTRLRQDEQRVRRDERSPDDGTAETPDDNEFAMDGDFPGFDQPAQYQLRAREDRPPREDRPASGERPAREERPRRDDRPQRDNAAPPRSEAVSEGAAGEAPSEAAPASAFEPAASPFVRGDRGTRGLRPRREDRRPRPDGADDDAPAGLDPASLPPSISRPEEAPAADEAPKPRRGRPRKPRPDDETLETVG